MKAIPQDCTAKTLIHFCRAAGLAGAALLSMAAIWLAHAEGSASVEQQRSLALAEELVTLITTDTISQLVHNSTDQMWPLIENRLRAYNQDIADSDLASLRQELERIQFDHLMAIVKRGPEIYARHFSEHELQDILAFYRTPAGRKLVKLMPALTTELLEAIKPELPAFYAQTTDAFKAVLRNRGLRM